MSQSMSTFIMMTYNVHNFLRDMQDMLYKAHITFQLHVPIMSTFIMMSYNVHNFLRNNIKTSQDRVRFYVVKHRQPHFILLGQKVFLFVPHDSTTLSTGNCFKLTSYFFGPFTALKHVGSSAYRFKLPAGIKVHPVFHVSHLKELLDFDDNLVSIKTLVTLQ